MTHQRMLTGILATLVFAGSSILPVSAQLPSLDKQPWIGYFAAFSNKRFQFGIAADGKIKLVPIGDKGLPVAHTMEIPIEIAIAETAPDGKTTLKKIKPETLTSKETPTAKLGKVTITGKVTGDASFEVTFEQQRDVISIGGRVLDPGTLKNPLQFSIRVKFPDLYSKVEKTGKKEEKIFEKMIAGDRVDLKYTDEKRKKLKIDEKISADSKEINGPGIAEAKIEISSYKGRKFEFSTTSNATLKFWNGLTAPLYEGFFMVWTPDPAKNVDGKARLSFEVK